VILVESQTSMEHSLRNAVGTTAITTLNIEHSVDFLVFALEFMLKKLKKLQFFFYIYTFLY